MIRTDHPTLPGVRAIAAEIVDFAGRRPAWRVVWWDLTTDEYRAEYVSWKAYLAIALSWRRN